MADERPMSGAAIGADERRRSPTKPNWCDDRVPENWKAMLTGRSGPF